MVTEVDFFSAIPPRSRQGLGQAQLEFLADTIAKLVQAGQTIPGLTGGSDVEKKGDDLVISRYERNERVVGKYDVLKGMDFESLYTTILKDLKVLSSLQ